MPPIGDHSFFELIFLKFQREKGHRGKANNFFQKTVQYSDFYICLCKKQSARRIYFLVRFWFILRVLVLKHVVIYGYWENMN